MVGTLSGISQIIIFLLKMFVLPGQVIARQNNILLNLQLDLCAQQLHHIYKMHFGPMLDFVLFHLSTFSLQESFRLHIPLRLCLSFANLV